MNIGSKALKYSALLPMFMSFSFAKKYRILGYKVYFFYEGRGLHKHLIKVRMKSMISVAFY